MDKIPSSSFDFFSFRVENETSTWYVPVTISENRFQLSSKWTTINVMGSTEAMSAFDHVENPTIPINLEFHEDMWTDYAEMFPSGYNKTYEQTVSKLVSLQYPIISNNQIKPPYVYISFDRHFVYRGYFTQATIIRDGPIRNTGARSEMLTNRPICKFSANFTVVSKTAPTQKSVAENYTIAYKG